MDVEFVLKVVPMDRNVRQLHTKPRKAEAEDPRPFSQFAEQPNIVLLGDPGAGKTYTFREAAAASGARLLTARSFLVTPASKSEDTLFIDGLDERRAGRGDRDTIDALVEKLFEVGPRKVRISCRAADWLGESDLSSLRPYFASSGEPAVLLLESLTPAEQSAVLVAQDMNTSDAGSFIREAQERGLGDFLENPQNLIMLLRAVRSGKWPATRKELFELSTHLMLQEFNSERARAGAGIYSVDELRPVAGAAFAARLVSDIEAISLTDQEGSNEIPSYRSLSIVDRTRLQAALGRRVFVAGPAAETVDYAHRTTAEYLGAAWLAEAVRSGLPFGRLQALMGVDGHPATELRGLHAWLAVHLPEYADRLVDTDPYGVLTYGDAASLTTSSCVHLVRALGRLSQTDPWFRFGNGRSPSIGGLARPDMIDEFRAVLKSPVAGPGVRSIVVEALALGTPLPDMKDDLFDVLVRQQSAYGERLHALLALFRMGANGEAAIAGAYAQLGSDEAALRLRGEIIAKLYGRSFGPSDIVELLKDTWDNDERTTSHVLWSLANEIPLGDLPEVLAGLERLVPRQDVNRRNAWEVAAFYERVLIRAWASPGPFDPDRALKWLRVRRSILGAYTSNRAEKLLAALREAPDRLRAIADRFLTTFVADDKSWLKFARFREATLFEISVDDLLDDVVRHMKAGERGSAKELFLYELAFSLAHAAAEAHGRATFDELYGLADVRADLQPVRVRGTLCALPAGYFPDATSPADDPAGIDPDVQRRNFENDADAIRSGRHLGWLDWVAKIYFAIFSDVDQSANPRARLAAVLGDANTQTALEGLQATLTRQDLPSMNAVVTLAAQNQHYDWWHALIAGLNERWNANPNFDGISDELLCALLVFDITNSITVTRDNQMSTLVHPWKEAALRDRPELVRDAYLAITRARLGAGQQYINGLHELLTEASLQPFRTGIALELLRDFPNAPVYQLGGLLSAAVNDPAAHADVLAVAHRVLTGGAAVDGQQHDMWLAAAYVLSPAQYQRDVEMRALAQPAFVFELRARTGFERYGENLRASLPLPQLEFLARLTGSLYPDAPFPHGGAWGEQNPWDASEYFRALTTTISSMPSAAATNALERLETNATLVSYKPHLLHALASQRARRRDAEYDRPDWPRTVKALANGAPATAADLHALLVAHLQDEAKRVARTNTDVYKSFWNVDQYSRPTAPRPEEACRDTLIDRLRTVLTPLGISVEPEGHMAGDRRADISVAMPGRKILCELKRDYHSEVWRAAVDQLERFYAHDPEAHGFGVYVVFWFGNNRPSAIPPPPGGADLPQSAAEMERMLRDRLPAGLRNRLAIVVLDVSGASQP
jgi:predicted NACHT family NTPase